ncbi:MAG: hypothetical protein RMJ33_02550 [Saprospiraceae bacterium]|nr:hypothetical protein [Saprospiraceae bacterium]MDW8228696.1 hypothetical protein [Saprospiraceae bacterium]
MLSLLSIVIGIVFVLLLFSLLATTVMEVVSGLLTLRGKNLINVLRSMLGDAFAEGFIQHPYYKQMGEKASFLGFLRRKTLPPSYLRPGTFAGILLDQTNIYDGEDIKHALEKLPEGRLKQVLIFLYQEAQGDVERFRLKVEEWYNEVMERASEWYVNNIRNWLIFIGFIIAVIFNVDVVNIYSTLSANAAFRDFLADAATQYVQTQPAPRDLDSALINPDLQAARARMDSLITNNIAALRSPLGIGWDNVKWPSEEERTHWWILKLVGWLTTALAISLGAKFWYDLLKQLVNFRGNLSSRTSGGAASGTPSAPILTQPDTGLLRKAPPAPPILRSAAKPPSDE